MAYDDLLDLIHKYCTAEQITALLRLGKGHKDVRITAESKEQLVNRNLREALDARAIPLDPVFALLREAEENGNHHTFYYRVSRRLIEHLTFDKVGYALFGKSWPSKTGFPRLTLKPQDYVISDFREYDPKKPRDWVLKLYGHELRERFKRIEEIGPEIHKIYVREEFRHVILVRLNAPDLLEVRVPRDESKQRIAGWLNTAWVMLQSALAKQQFAEWDLNKTRRMLVETEDKNASLYHIRDTRIVDSNDTRASFEAHATQGNLFAANETKEAIKGLLKANGECTHAAILWLPHDGLPADVLRTLVGHNQPNEVIFSGSMTARDVDYVTEQLRTYSRRTS